jgi:nicotinamide-nucleotide adenylyltransferase
VEPDEALSALRDSPTPRLVLWPDDDPDPRAWSGPGGGAPANPASVGLLSGSFDPPTAGHEELARAAGRRLDLVVLVVSARTLPKEAGTATALLDDGARLRALEAFVRARSGLALGLASHGLLSEQAVAAAERFPRARRSLVMGSDKLVQLLDPGWYEDRGAALTALFAAADVLVAEREGDGTAMAEALREAARLGWAEWIARLDADPRVAAVSSRTVRDGARAGADVSDLVPPEVLPYVLEAVRRER